jgi:hypothetical protein
VTDEDSGSPEFDSPLDDLFVEGARYREPSAEERARQAREFQKQGQAAAKANRRRHKRDQRGHPSATGHSRRWWPWAGLAVVVLAVWGLMSLGSGGDNDNDPATTSTSTTTTTETTTSLLSGANG